MALILGALLIQGIQPGPQLMSEHADLFWGLIASFWVGNVLLVLLNVPLIGVWVKLLQVPYRYMFPCALFFIAVGVYSTKNSMFDVMEIPVFGLLGAILLYLEFPLAPIVLGYVLGPLVEENFRRALILSRGDLAVFYHRPISATIISVAALLVVAQLYFGIRAARRGRSGSPLIESVDAASQEKPMSSDA